LRGAAIGEASSLLVGPSGPASEASEKAGETQLHLPAGWPWAAWFELALARLRCIAYAT
jgi:hypothetical protein